MKITENSYAHHKPNRQSALFWFLRGTASGQGFAFAKGAGDSALEEGPFPRAWDPLLFCAAGNFPMLDPSLEQSAFIV